MTCFIIHFFQMFLAMFLNIIIEHHGAFNRWLVIELEKLQKLKKELTFDTT